MYILRFVSVVNPEKRTTLFMFTGVAQVKYVSFVKNEFKRYPLANYFILLNTAFRCFLFINKFAYFEIILPKTKAKALCLSGCAQ